MSKEPPLPLKSQKLWTAIIQADANRALLMPTEHDALVHMCQARQRLRDLGWHDGIYAPKDGTVFQVVEIGSTGIFDCYYSGEWPDGYWNTMDDRDCYPSSSAPILYRLKPAHTSAMETK